MYFSIFKNQKRMTIIERAKAPTPKFFKVLRNIGLALAAAGGALLAAPISLPAGIVALGGYLTVGGTVLTAVSQVTVEDSAKADRKDG
jgi:ABC-type xylose transport system permease subunit